jgi:hypothetical protein
LAATFLAATAGLASATLLLALALLALTFLSLAISLLAALLSGAGRFARFVRIVLFFHNIFRFLLISNWSQRGLR